MTLHTFDGETYEKVRDQSRLSAQFERVRDIMSDGAWHTLTGVQKTVEKTYGKRYSQAGISARIRDLRKERFGGHVVERRYIEDGLWEYRMAV